MSNDLERLFDKKYLDCRADQIPCTVKETYFKPDNTKDDGMLIRKELISLDESKRVILGIEYDDKGQPAEVYTTDAKGKRIKLVAENPQQSNKLPDLISKRLEQARNLANTKEQPTVTKEQPTAPKRTIKKQVTKVPLANEHEL